MPVALHRAAHRYPLPAFGEPLRVAFVGQESYFSACALHQPAGALLPAFIDFRGGADPLELRAALRAAAPHVVVVFRPEIVPAGLFADLRAAAVGFITEPLPRPQGADHPDLSWRLSELALTDAANFDRIVSFDPLVADTADSVVAVWRSLPLPVDDRLYAPVRPAGRPPRALFVGYSTDHRERTLIQAKHEYDVLHYAHGLWGERLREVFATVDVGINVHGERYPTFENRVLLHLAAGHLLLSEALSPLHGLEPEIDFVSFASADELLAALHQIWRRPDMYERVRLRGRAKAEDYRASRVYPRLLGDLVADLATFGTARRVS